MTNIFTFIAGEVVISGASRLRIQPESWRSSPVEYPQVFDHPDSTVCICVCQVASVVSDCTSQTVARQDPLSVGFSRQEYWSGLTFPSPGVFLTLGSNPGLMRCRCSLYCLGHQGSPYKYILFGFFSLVGYYTLPSIVPCAILFSNVTINL